MNIYIYIYIVGARKKTERETNLLNTVVSDSLGASVPWSRRTTQAVFKRHLLSSQFSLVQFSSAQFEQQATTGHSLSTTAMVFGTVRVYKSLCGHLGIVV